MDQHLMTLCGQQVPGDTFRNLRIEPDYSARTFKHTLVPVWLLTYTFGAKTFQVIVNGATGTIAGQYPKSPWKIALRRRAGAVDRHPVHRPVAAMRRLCMPPTASGRPTPGLAFA